MITGKEISKTLRAIWNIAGKAPRTFCDVLLSMTFSYGCMTLRLQSERQIPVRYIWLKIVNDILSKLKRLTIVTFISIHILEVHSLCSSAFRKNDKAILDIFADELWVQISQGIVGAPANHYFSVHQEQIRHNRYTCTCNHWSELAAASRRASPAIIVCITN